MAQATTATSALTTITNGMVSSLLLCHQTQISPEFYSSDPYALCYHPGYYCHWNYDLVFDCCLDDLNPSMGIRPDWQIWSWIQKPRDFLRETAYHFKEALYSKVIGSSGRVPN